MGREGGHFQQVRWRAEGPRMQHMHWKEGETLNTNLKK